MADMAEATGEVRITLKDVYQQTQSLEKSLGDALSTLNLTMQQIKGHIEQLDNRNAAADQIHVEHAQRITATETALARADLAVRLPDHEVRVRSLERFKYLLLGAVIVVNAAADWLVYLLTHHK